MKLILTLLIVLKITSSFGQVFLNETKKWNDLYSFYATCNCSLFDTHSYYLDGDSTINENLYKVLYDSIYSGPSNSGTINVTKKGFIREINDGNIIFYIEDGSTEETKIYDFELISGSSITIGLYEYTVHSTDSIEFFGEKRKVLYMTEYGEDGLYWISGIGSNRGLFYFQYEDAKLLCVHDNNELIYENQNGYDCIFFDYIDSVDDIKFPKIKAYPNPTNDKFLITSNKILESVEIFNSTGKRILTANPNKTEFSVDLKNQNSGIYFIRIDNQSVKMIKN